ncbi:MAG: hypothetical protein HGA39_01685 [Coriobacteriia bacterium]|nr:hypothetical protein [Coriobacteriia bacterium]
MNYTELVGKGFKGLKSGTAWGFWATVQAAVLGLYLVLVGAAVAAAGGPGALETLWNRLIGGVQPSLTMLMPLIVIYAAFVVAALLAIPLRLIGIGGLVHITDEFQSGRKVTVGGAWGWGAGRIGRVFLIQLVLGVAAFLAAILALVPFFIGIASVARTGDAGGGALVGGLCGTSLLMLLMLLVLFFLSAFIEIVIRYAVIGDRGAGSALSAGWKAFRACFKYVFMFLVITYGILLAIGVIDGIVNSIIQAVFTASTAMFSSASSDSAQEFGTVLKSIIVTLPVSLAVGFLTTILNASLWTAFFRRMTGLDPDAPRAVYPPPSTPTQEWWTASPGSADTQVTDPQSPGTQE